MTNSRKHNLARLENKFIFNAHYFLSANEQKIILFLISHLDPKTQKDFHKQVVTIKGLENFLNEDGKKWGSVYERMNDLCNRLTDRKISFSTDFLLDGKPIKGYVNWFQSIMPTENDAGEVCLEFMFSEYLKPFLLRLNEYVKINTLEVAHMSRGHAIRLYQIFKAERDRTRMHKKVTKMRFNINELKAILGISGKYGKIQDFRRYVLEPSEEEINNNTNFLYVSTNYLRKGRRVAEVEFSIRDKQPTDPRLTATTNGTTDLNEQDAEQLPWAQRKALEQLVEFGVIEGIALKQLLPTIKGSEFIGFEDYFVKAALSHFQQWAKNPNPGVFVNWWLDNKVFDTSSDVWSKMVEQVVADKKNLQQNDPEAFDNRLVAKDMSYGEFVAWYKAEREQSI